LTLLAGRAAQPVADPLAKVLDNIGDHTCRSGFAQRADGSLSYLVMHHYRVAKLAKGEIRSAIERVAQFADERSRAIRVQFVAGEVKVFSSSVETGESEESVTSEYAGPELEIGFNAQYLLDFFRAISQDHLVFAMKDQKSAGELRPVTEGPDQYRYVVMPMRL